MANIISDGINHDELPRELQQIRTLQLAGASFVPQPQFAGGDAGSGSVGAFAGYKQSLFGRVDASGSSSRFH